MKPKGIYKKSASLNSKAGKYFLNKQKGDAASIRDLANQRLESQDNNKLYMDVKLKYT